MRIAEVEIGPENAAEVPVPTEEDREQLLAPLSPARTRVMGLARVSSSAYPSTRRSARASRLTGSPDLVPAGATVDDVTAALKPVHSSTGDPVRLAGALATTRDVLTR